MSESQRIESDNQKYLQNSVNPILESVMIEVVTSKPKDQVQFMLKSLAQNYGERATIGDRDLLNLLREEVKRLELKISEKKHHKKKGEAESDQEEGKDDDKGSEQHTEEDDEDDVEEILPEKMAAKKERGPRNSVSAEAFGEWNKKSDFKPKVVNKSDEIRHKILARLNEAFMFSALADNEKKIVVDAMAERKVKKGEHVINQGEEGDDLYVVENGVLSCFKLFTGKKELTFLKNYKPGESFGELALLYNAPRAATIIADDDAILWSLDRYTFNHIVKDAASKKREKYEKFLEQVHILQTMDNYERSKLADAFKEAHYKEGETIIKEGEEGNIFFIVTSGEARATKTVKAGDKPIQVMEYKVGDYFGERALLKNEPRAANVLAKHDCSVVTMDRHSFKRLMGPLKDILRRNMDLYEQFKVEE